VGVILMSNIRLFFVALFALTATSAQAFPLLWTLEDWTFDDGGSVTGSFIYDAQTREFSNIDMISTGGVQTTHYTVLQDYTTFAPFEELATFAPANFTTPLSAPLMQVALNFQLTDAGGTVDLSTGALFPVIEDKCFANPANCGPGGTFPDFRFTTPVKLDPATGQFAFTGTNLVASAVPAVPLPASALLLMGGLAMLRIKARRKTV
jgi:hypothetical protein